MALDTITEPPADPALETPPEAPPETPDEEPGGTITILLPGGEMNEPFEPLAARRESLAGSVVGIIDNNMWRSMAILADELARLLVERAGAAEVVVTTAGPMHGADPERYHQEMEAFHAEVDAVISGLGN